MIWEWGRLLLKKYNGFLFSSKICVLRRCPYDKALTHIRQYDSKEKIWFTVCAANQSFTPVFTRGEKDRIEKKMTP